MKVVQWNISKKNQSMSGVKRYEDELYARIREQKEIELERIQQEDYHILGNTVVSWFLKYKAGDAQIIHATYQTVAPAVYIRKPERFIITVHDLIPLLYPSVLKKDLLVGLQWLLTPGALKKADAIIAISGFTKNEVVRLTGVSASKIHVIHEAADTAYFHPMNRTECKQKFGLSLSEKHVLVIASNNENKRMDLVHKVINELRKQRKDIKLLKAGYAEELHGEGIINMGSVAEEDMPALYNSADVFLNTSEYEGFCLPVLEAMSCGIPVVVSNKASIPEVVGAYGNMVDLDAKDVIEQFAAKILDNIDTGLDERALEQSKRFSWEKTARETIEVYRNVCGK